MNLHHRGYSIFLCEGVTTAVIREQVLFFHGGCVPQAMREIEADVHFVREDSQDKIGYTGAMDEDAG